MKRFSQNFMFVTAVMASLFITGLGRAADPVAVVSISGVANIVEDIKFLTAAANMAQFGQIAETMSEGFTNGVDADKPIGMVISFENNNFEPLVFIPVSDMKAALQTLTNNVGKPKNLGNGTYEVQGPQPSYLREQNGWAFVSNTIDGLKNLPNNPQGILESLDENYDIAIRANLENIPEEYRSMVLDQMREGVQQGLDRLPDESDEQYEVRKGLVESQMEQMETLLNETDQVTFGWLIDGNKQKTHMDMTVTAKPGTNLASQMNQMKDTKTRFAGFHDPDAAIMMHSASKLRKQDVEQIQGMLASVKEQALEEIANDDDIPNDEARGKAKEVVSDLFEILDDTLATRVMDGGMSVSFNEQSMTMVSGLHVADGRKVEEALKKVVEMAEQEPDFPGIKFNADRQGTASFHTMRIPIPEEEKARQIFGDELDVAIGIDKQAAYFAMGDNCLSKLKTVISKSGTPKALQEPFAMHVALTPIAEFIASVEENPMVGTVLDALKNSGGKDHLRIKGIPVSDGITYRLEIEEGVLKAIGQGAMMAQGGGF